MSFLFWFFLILIVFLLLLILHCNEDNYESISSYFSLTQPKRKLRYQIYNSNPNAFYYSNRRSTGYSLDGAQNDKVKFNPRKKFYDEKTQRIDNRISGNKNITPNPTYPKPKPVEVPQSRFPDIRKEKGGFHYKPAKLSDLSHSPNSREQSPLPQVERNRSVRIVNTGSGRAYDNLFEFD